MKREAGDISVGLADLLPHSPPRDLAANCARSIFNNLEVVASRDLQNRGQIAGQAHLVNTEDRPRSLSDRLLDTSWINIERSRVDVDEDGARSAVSNTVGRSDVGVTDCDDFVARAHSHS